VRWLYAQNLWWLAAVPALVVAYAVFFARRSRLLMRIGHLPMVERMVGNVSLGKKYWKAALFVMAVGLLATALGRPQVAGPARLMKQHGLDLVVALDFSKSMLARDLYPSRIERAKRELERLIDDLSGDRVGLVAFAGETLKYPLTTDYAAAKLFWRDMKPEDMPVGGTAIGKAISAATDMLKRARQSGRPRAQVILLLTDGEDTESEPLAAATEAGRLGIRIYSVGIGSRSGELVPEVGEDGALTGYLRREDGGYVYARLDEDMLRKAAQLTGGEYFRVDAKRFGVESVEAALRTLQRAEHEARLVKQYGEGYAWFLLPAFLALVGEACLGDRKRFVERRREVVEGAAASAQRARRSDSRAA
jgi:Ca-activated chloride channel family protein